LFIFDIILVKAYARSAYLPPLRALSNFSAAVYWLSFSILLKIRPVSPYPSTVDPPFLAYRLGIVVERE